MYSSSSSSSFDSPPSFNPTHFFRWKDQFTAFLQRKKVGEALDKSFMDIVATRKKDKTIDSNTDGIDML
jgi:hypothetical protein